MINVTVTVYAPFSSYGRLLVTFSLSTWVECLTLTPPL